MASTTPIIYQNKVPLELSHGKKTTHHIIAKTNKLKKDLKTLSKAEEVNVRFQQAKELLFRTKYEKYLTRGNFETSLVTKDGFTRIIKENSHENICSTQQIPLHKLIYTNGEVDVDKVLCLHLLSVQYIDNTYFNEKKNFSVFKKRSKTNLTEASPLPFYTLEIIHEVKMKKTDFRVGDDLIVLVNSSLEKLVTAILEVIAIVSPLKLQKIKELSLSKKLIKEMIIKTKILNFLAHVQDYPAMLKLENYRLEIAQYQMEPSLSPQQLSICNIAVKDKSKKLELIQSEVKKRVITLFDENLRNSESWSMQHRNQCNCKKISRDTRNVISLLTDEGREFALVTGSGCRLPSGSSVCCPSLTAIIKSSPKPWGRSIYDTISGYSSNSKEPLMNINEQNKLLSSLLHKVNNTHRILIGKTMAELKSNRGDKKAGKQKIPINKIIEKVFSKESLISFASNAENEELKLMFQPCCKGGLGMGSSILEAEKKKPNRNKYPNYLQANGDDDDEIVPHIIRQEKSILNVALIKQDIFTSEIRNKIKYFLQSDNPGFINKLKSN